MFLSKKAPTLAILVVLPIALWQPEISAGTANAFTDDASPTLAVMQNERELDECKAELRAHYGEGTKLKLVDRRRYQHGTRMRVAARLDADNSHFATCWVPRQDEVNLSNRGHGFAKLTF